MPTYVLSQNQTQTQTCDVLENESRLEASASGRCWLKVLTAHCWTRDELKLELRERLASKRKTRDARIEGEARRPSSDPSYLYIGQTRAPLKGAERGERGARVLEEGP